MNLFKYFSGNQTKEEIITKYFSHFEKDFLQNPVIKSAANPAVGGVEVSDANGGDDLGFKVDIGVADVMQADDATDHKDGDHKDIAHVDAAATGCNVNNDGVGADATGRVDSSNPSPAVPVSMRLDVEPVNEFLNNDMLLCGNFFDIIGSLRSLSKFKTNCLSKPFTAHLLLQFTKSAASSSPFLFFVMDQIRRFECVRKTALKLKNAHPDKKRDFENFLKSEGLQAMVTNAITNPGSDAAKSLLRRVEPFVNFASNQIPYSNAQRKAFLSTLYANCVHRGLPSIFFTLSNDVKGIFQLRMSFPLENGNHLFPSDAKKFLHSLDEGQENCDGICVRNDELGELLSQNPVAAASTFIRLLRCVWNNLFGLSMEDEVKGTVSHLSREGGIFNRVYGCNSIIETQDRDLGLHTHGVLWTKLSPWLMTLCADIRQLREKVCSGIYYFIFF